MITCHALTGQAGHWRICQAAPALSPDNAAPQSPRCDLRVYQGRSYRRRIYPARKLTGTRPAIFTCSSETDKQERPLVRPRAALPSQDRDGHSSDPDQYRSAAVADHSRCRIRGAPTGSAQAFVEPIRAKVKLPLVFRSLSWLAISCSDSFSRDAAKSNASSSAQNAGWPSVMTGHRRV